MNEQEDMWNKSGTVRTKYFNFLWKGSEYHQLGT